MLQDSSSHLLTFPIFPHIFTERLQWKKHGTAVSLKNGFLGI